MSYFQKVLPILFLVLGFCQTNAQQIKRSVVGSIGTTISNSDYTLHTTFAQPPGVGVVYHNDHIIRQGFQQPVFNCKTLTEIDHLVVMESCSTNDGSIDLDVSELGEELMFFWSNGTTDQDLENVSAGTYQVQIEDECGCQNTFAFVVGKKCEDKLTIFDIITPNEDGINDAWTIQGLEQFPNNSVEIFNRWGAKIYSKEGYTNDWNGTSENGKCLPIGAYYYILKLEDADDTVLNGSVTIVR